MVSFQPAALGLVGGLVAVSAGAGLAAQRVAMSRMRAGAEDDPYAEEGFGGLRGRSGVVTADDGVELYVEVDEPDHGADLTVLFCHGYGLNMDSWHFQRKALRGSARLVFADQRSHGRSGRAPQDSVSMDRLGDDVAQIIDAVVPSGPVVLVGHSMGGMTVMAYADQYPEQLADRVVGVGLITTSAGGLGEVALGVRGSAGEALLRFGNQASNVLARGALLVDYARRRESDLAHLVTKLYSFGTPVPDSVVDFTAAMNAATPIEVIRDFLPIFATHDRTQALPALRETDVLVMGAGRDYLTPVDHSREMVALIPTAEYVEVDDAGHMLMLERHELVSDHLAALLRRVRRQS